MGNCVQCKHWSDIGMPTRGNWRTCYAIDSQPEARAESNAGIATGPEECSAYLRTGPLFGCTMFEPRSGDNNV